jgi:glycosyltransferase involved in cell wall biosynthesis
MATAASLKVVHLSSAHYAGDTRILHKECRSLANAGHDVTLVARHERDTIVGGVKIKALCNPKSRWDRWTSALWRVYRQVAGLHADLYHFHDPELIPVGMWLSLQGKRVIYDAHEDLPNTFAYKYYIPAFARKTLAWLAGRIENLAVRRFAAVVAATPTIAQRFSEYNTNTVVVRNFPSLAELMLAPKLPWNDRPPLVVYVGSMAPERGFREAVTAISLLPEELNARLAFGGPVTPELREEIGRLPGSDRTDLLGVLGRVEVASLLGRARVGLVPLHRMPSFLNALPVKLFEYMSAGVPVVASDFPLWRQIIEDAGCGLLVDPCDSNGMARAIEYLLTHPEEAERMGARGREAIERRYNWKTEEQQLLALYNAPCCQPKRPGLELSQAAWPVCKSRSSGAAGGISRAARCWALKELARRAGVSNDFFKSWVIEVSRGATIVHMQPGTDKQIVFRNLSQESGDDLASPEFRTVHARWMSFPRPISTAFPDLIVPYCDRAENGLHPLFRQAGANRIECFADLPASTLFTLCRVEETQQRHLDVHSRFAANMSVACRDGFFDRPVVDEWGLAFGQAIEALVPGWRPTARTLRVKISHDIDEVGVLPRLRQFHRNGNGTSWVRTGWMILPFDLRHAIKLSLEHRDPFRGAAQLLRTLAPGQPSCLGLVQTLVSADLERGLDSAVYWKASGLGPFDSGYDLRRDRIRNVIHWLQEHNVENGFHPGYATFRCPEELQVELQMLRSVFGEQPLGGRQHYLRWCPETWIDWENCGLAYDSSVGYPDRVGFRAGTCIPYRPWLLSLDREARLLEIPLLVMDSCLLDSTRVRGNESLDAVSRLIDKCRVVGGVFTLLSHNTTLRNPSFVRPYEQILDMLASSDRFDWQSSLSNEWS